MSWERIVEHIDHVVKLVGADHVGLGSDFDGANMPDGMEDCSKLPKITEALLRRGYAEDDIRKILGGNTLRVHGGSGARQPRDAGAVMGAVSAHTIATTTHGRYYVRAAARAILPAC